MPDDLPLPLPLLSQYGLTMLHIQFFERGLALHAMTLTRKSSTRQLKSPEAIAQALDRMQRRIEHMFQKASVSELRNMLPDDFDPELFAEIEALIPIRTRVAHRYLLECLAHRDQDPLGARATAELATHSNQFRDVTGRLDAAQAALMATLPTPDAPSELRELIEQIVTPTMKGTPPGK